MIGFTNLGDINKHLIDFERSLDRPQQQQEPLANSMLVLMVRGLFNSLEFPYVQFPCNEISGDQLYDPFWEAVRRLELCGFSVLVLICDGLAANRRLFRLHNPQASPVDVYKVSNPYSCNNRFIQYQPEATSNETRSNAFGGQLKRVCVHHAQVMEGTVDMVERLKHDFY